MGVLTAVGEAFGFFCSANFWRMAVLWTVTPYCSYLKLLCQKCKRYPPRCSPEVSGTTTMGRPVCIVTGATSGLGAEAAYALSKEGFYVVLVGRSSDHLSKAVSHIKRRSHDAFVKAFEVNLSNFKSIVEFKHSFLQWLGESDLHPSIQLLINNAGILATSQRLTNEGYDQMMATNYIGAFCLTKILLPLLENSPIPARVVNVTSFTHWNVCCGQADRETVSGRRFLESNNYPFAQIYEFSKLSMVLFTYELHRQVGLLKKSQHISVVAADPGVVKTNIMRELPPPISQLAFISLKLLGLLQSSETGACSMLDAALAPPEVSGVYFFGGKGRSLNSSPLSYDANLARDLWTTSCNLFEELQISS